MPLYLLTIAGGVATAWTAAVLLLGRFLLRPRPHRITRPSPSRPAPKRREDFTLAT